MRIIRHDGQEWVPYSDYSKLSESLGGDRIEMVDRFMMRFSLGYSGPPRELPASIASLRKKLLGEECQELVDAIDRGELHEQLDALCDLLYVVYGTAITMGFRRVLDDAFVRVHNSNMTKVRAKMRQDSKRDNVSDIVKPQGWKPPDLRDLVRDREQ